MGSVGSEDLNMTITGGLDACKLNVPTTVGVASNGSMYIGTLTEGNYKNYKLNASSSLYEMSAQGKLFV